jgi:restriction system protein
MAQPPENLNANITPVDFELLVKEYMTNLGRKIKNFKILHNTKIIANDGDYQIDVYVEYEILEVDFKIIIECKRYKNRIKREIVQLLYDKLRATGSQKGIIFSTSSFQKGAVLFAERHGIALIKVIEGK